MILIQDRPCRLIIQNTTGIPDLGTVNAVLVCSRVAFLTSTHVQEYMYVWSSHMARVRINRVSMPILLVVS